MKNSSPKGKVLNILEMTQDTRDFEVRGTRVKGRLGGEYLTEAVVHGRVVARARHRDWRKSYKMLEIEASRACGL
jgi:hypothetical protein